MLDDRARLPMKTKKKSALCIVQSQDHANRVVEALHAAGFYADDISVLLPSRSGTRDFAHEHNTKAPEGAIAGVGAGGVLGGALGLLAGLGSIAIPGVGLFLAAGPLFAAMSGVGAGAALGGVTGALIGMEFPEMEARRYEGKVKGGNILISVHAETTEALRRAEAVLRLAHAEDICTSAEASVPAVA
jgi:hypothetical protein